MEEEVVHHMVAGKQTERERESHGEDIASMIHT
jgi:hypothetical protein